MALRLLIIGARRSRTPFKPIGSAGAHNTIRSIIGNRDIVGYGVNGAPEYVDRVDFPMPALRWMETTPDIVALREKEKGDWRKLTLDEKKCLYRSNFRQTFSEFQAPTGDWKSIIGCTLFITTFGIVIFLLEIMFVYSNQERPVSFSDEHKRAQLRRMFDLRMEPITGISSQWNYEKDTWKK
ncbi:hypothetical protein ILUMI_09455 [Ignelater luminosus]|uniref:Cytochrome c oxidase subunit 4 n=1 Tax=Ignelater luminosus TaxID=2038154 RepID=A0A8K0CZQ8_IGNLU|nr:hypothetical protein ILUMI_09455 [Ignelater luminosus]